MDQVQSVSSFRLAYIQSRALSALVSRVFTSPFKGKKGASTYYKDVMFSSMRALLSRSNISVNKALDIPTDKVYADFCKANKLEPQVTELADTKGLWIGSQSAKNIIVYFHGGGYVMSAVAPHFSWGVEITTAQPDTAFVLLSYTVAPQGQYPTQLRQAITLMRHLVETEKRDPSNILLAGDSAGGNLALGVLSHVAHPHPSIPALSISSPFRAAILVSPWVSFDLEDTLLTSSVVVNKERDMFGPSVLSLWGSAYMGDAAPDPYNQPLTASADWWLPVAKDAVKDVFIWGGEGEILVDTIKELAWKMTSAFECAGRQGAVKTILEPRAGHDELLMDKMLGCKNGVCQDAVDSFVKAKL